MHSVLDSLLASATRPSFSGSPSFLYKWYPLSISGSRSKPLVLFLVRSKKKTLTKASLRNVTWSACNVHSFCLSNSAQEPLFPVVASLQCFGFTECPFQNTGYFSSHSIIFLGARRPVALSVLMLHFTYLFLRLLWRLSCLVSMQLSLRNS